MKENWPIIELFIAFIAIAVVYVIVGLLVWNFVSW